MIDLSDAAGVDAYQALKDSPEINITPAKTSGCRVLRMRAKKLLKEAGYPEGLTVNLSVGSGWAVVVRYAKILKQDTAPAGIKINIKTMPNSQYWKEWTEVAFGTPPGCTVLSAQ